MLDTLTNNVRALAAYDPESTARQIQDPAAVHADLVDDRFIRNAIRTQGGAATLGLPADLTRIELVTS
ncbi:hypothetical protein IA539_03555 [Gordonia sp. zg691]|uniref:hypothetical protein n=1 Tax=Gordonia jinghuaiqii TaxID=2758710 RepID=UPI001662287B|nr:hypothetical protein [Gordonia jinghuaiqii]MBD0860284.1 hypothetical protein [Gordonia jinghuaiqii]